MIISPLTARRLCAGRQFPDVSRLDWLAALCSFAEDQVAQDLVEDDADPGAVLDAVAECRGLLHDLRAACRSEEALEEVEVYGVRPAALSVGQLAGAVVIAVVAWGYCALVLCLGRP